MIIEHNLHHDISYTTESCSSLSSDESLDTPLLSNKSMSANTEFNDLFAYFSDDSDDLIFQRRSSVSQMKGFSAKTPMLPLALAEHQEMK